MAILCRLPGGISAPRVLLGLVGVLAALGVFASAASAQGANGPTIVIIGDRALGPLATPLGQHDWVDGVLKIQRLIDGAPALASQNPNVKAYPAGFPEDLAELDGASTIVLYFGSVQRKNPVEEPAVKAKLEELMAGGAGLVALHQSFTLEDGASVPFDQWLGGYRQARKDYTIETAPLTVVAGHPVSRGLEDFAYLDEFYPSIEFAASPADPILTGRVHVQGRDGQGMVFEEPSSERVVAWAHERSSGGRSFGYSGLHFLEAFDQPQVQTMVLNAIMWTAGLEVPAEGVVSQERELLRVVLPKADVETLPQSWGQLRWFVSRQLGNSANLTVGEARVLPGHSNPPHWHPNTDEVLHLVQGHLMHRVGDREYEMKAGDTVVIPEGAVHNARNIGEEEAIMIVSFNSPDRLAIDE